MINFLHSYLPDPILLHLGPVEIHWYSLMVILGIIAGLAVALKLARRQNILPDEVYNLAFYVIIFGLLGARIYSVFLDFGYYLKNPFEIIAVWHGGLAIHGAILGGIFTVVIYSWRKKQNFWQWADIIAPALALAQAIGRWGNYFNQEVFGQPTNLSWGIPIAPANRPAAYLDSQYFHPTFLYESALDLLNFLFLISLFFWTKKRNQEARSKKQESRIKNQGLVFVVYLINYSLIRIAMEFLRADETPVLFGIRLPVLVSSILIIISASFIFLLLRKTKR